jgi:hypothetical protein
MIDRLIDYMKAVNIIFEDKEIEELEKIKDGLSWRKFILKMLEDYKNERSKNNCEN